MLRFVLLVAFVVGGIDAAHRPGPIPITRGGGPPLPSPAGPPPTLSPLRLPSPSTFFGIRVVDSRTGDGIPLVQLRTSHYVVAYTDSLGYIAFFEPGLMDTAVWFSVLTDGYNLMTPLTPCDPDDPNNEDSPCDPGVLLMTTSGGFATIIMDRRQIAERAYRLTGASLYSAAVLLGIPSPVSHPLLDPSGATGQDTVITGEYKGKLFWFFGDTVCARGQRQDNCGGYGMYTVGATSSTSSPPNAPPDLTYFSWSDGYGVRRVSPMAPIGNLSMNTWIGAVFTTYAGLPNETMYCVYNKPFDFGPHPTTPVTGLAAWSDTLSQFVAVNVFPNDSPLYFTGDHAVERFNPALDEGRDHVYLTAPAYLRAAFADVTDLTKFETFTPLAQGSTMAAPRLDPNGYTWKKGMELFGPGQEANLLARGVLPRAMARYSAVDTATGAPVGLGGGSLNWNKYLQRYVLMSSPYMGFSANLTGPWKYVTTILGFERTGSVCYNPQQIVSRNDKMGTDQHIFYSCSYTVMWSNNPPSNPNVTNLWSTCLFGQNARMGCSPVVPHYEYNNLVHRIDLGALPPATLAMLLS